MPEVPAAAGALLALGGAQAPDGIAPEDFGPGLIAFVVTFSLVVVVVLLLRDFTRRVRRLQHRGQAAEREAAARAEAGPSALPRPGGPPDPGRSGPVPPGAGARGPDGRPGPGATG